MPGRAPSDDRVHHDRRIAPPVEPLATLLAPARVVPQLEAAGLSASAAARQAALLERCAHALLAAGAPPARPACALYVPGRIEALGKHTDYAGGRSLLAAVERGVALVAAPRADDLVNVTDAGRAEAAALRMAPDLRSVPGDWRNYPATATRRLARDFATARRGADIAFASDLPAADGMSSSSALVVAVSLALAAVNGLGGEEAFRARIACDEELADYLAAVESGAAYGALAGDRGVGTRGGSSDHTAILCARAGHLVQYAFGPARFERALPLPSGHVFVVASSGVRAEKTGAAMARYNLAAAHARAAAELWCAATGRDDPTLGAALELGEDAGARLRRILSDSSRPDAPAAALLARLEQFVAESREIVPAAGDALAAGDLAAFGREVDRSQALAERALGNQIEETVWLARAARKLGAAAASAFGAGFGGSVWALVAETEADPFAEAWAGAYAEHFPARAAAARSFVTPAGPPAARLF